MDDNKYVPLIIESDNADPIKHYSTSDYAHKHRCSRIVRRKGEVKEFRLTWL